MSEEVNETTYSPKAARAGKDIGKPGKMFSKIAKSAGEHYGSSESGKKVAGAVLAKIRAKHMKEESGETYDTTTHSPTAVKPIKKVKGNPPVQPVATHEEVEQIDELSKKTLATYAIKAKNQMGRDEYRAGVRMGQRNGRGQDEMEKAHVKRADKRHHGLDMALNKLAKEEVEETSECNMLDTALSDVAQSPKGEVYKKTSEKSTAPTKPTGTMTHVVSNKTGEAYNTTPMTKRMPALESAIQNIMQRSLEVKKIYAESAEIAIISPEQREDWMNVERGTMNVVDYFNKYRVTGEQ